VKNELIKLQKNTPTSLVQTYYSCVLAPWPSFLAAVGIGSSSAGVFLAVGFAFYVLGLTTVLNRFFGANIPSKTASVSIHSAICSIFSFLILYGCWWFPLCWIGGCC
jgi:Na+-driven multidrug efflux pump